MLRCLTTQTIGGRGILGTHLVGVLASELPTGFAQPGLLNNDVAVGDPAGCLYRLEITGWPSAGTLSVDEYGAFSFTGAPDGAYTAGERVDKFNPASGLFYSDTATLSMNVGPAVVNLVGTNSSQANSSSTGAVTVTPAVNTVNLVGTSCTQGSTSAAAAVTVTPAVNTVSLAGASSTQASFSGTGAVTVTPAASTVNLIGSACFQSASGSAGAVGVIPAAKTVALVGTSCVQGALSGAGATSVGARPPYARAPAGAGYRPHHWREHSCGCRPPEIQRNCR